MVPERLFANIVCLTRKRRSRCMMGSPYLVGDTLSLRPTFLVPRHPLFVELLLLACNCQPGDYQLGQDMVFFRSNKGGILQELMMMRKDKVAERIS